jgi:hypothetical protein
MTYTTPELVRYGKVLALTNGGGPGSNYEATETGYIWARIGYVP